MSRKEFWSYVILIIVSAPADYFIWANNHQSGTIIPFGLLIPNWLANLSLAITVILFLWCVGLTMYRLHKTASPFDLSKKIELPSWRSRVLWMLLLIVIVYISIAMWYWF